MRRGSLIASLALVLALALFVVVLGGKPDPAVLRQPLVIAGLRPMGIVSPSWQTMVMFAARDVDLPRERVFAAFDKVESWPQWAGPMIVDARWIDLPGWRAGARFEQTADLGFPFRRLQSIETVGGTTPGRLVSWASERGWMRSNHIWSFEDLPDGGTRVTEVAIFHGPLIGAARPFVESRWQERFDTALDGLLVQARRPRG